MSARKLSIALDEKVAEAAAASAERAGLSLSAWLNRAAENALAVEGGLAGVADGNSSTANSPPMSWRLPTPSWIEPAAPAEKPLERSHL